MSWTTAYGIINYPFWYGPPPFEPLHIAARDGHIEKMSQLLSQGANVDQLTRCKDTPLHIAAFKGTSLEVVKMLVEAGADVDHRNEDKFTPLMYACIEGHDSIVSYLVKNGAEVNARGNYGMTPLLFAIYARFLRVPLISTLLKAEACVNGCDSDGVTPLHAIINRRGRLHDDAQWDVMELLLSYPCDINAKQNFGGFTPLHEAVRMNDRKAALLLIMAGCKVDNEDNLGRVPMSHAIKDKHYHLMELFLAAGERISRADWIVVRRELESEDPSMPEHLLAVVAECPKLSILCRRSFYDYYGSQSRNEIENQPLPPLIKRYLSFKIL